MKKLEISPKIYVVFTMIFAGALMRLIPHWPNFTPIAAIASYNNATRLLKFHGDCWFWIDSAKTIDFDQHIHSIDRSICVVFSCYQFCKLVVRYDAISNECRWFNTSLFCWSAIPFQWSIRGPVLHFSIVRSTVLCN